MVATETQTLARARKSGLVRPRGETDSAGRWYPDPEEEACTCCAGIRAPSRAWPRSVRAHCASAAHCEHLAAERPEVFAHAVAEVERRAERAARYLALVPEIPAAALRVLASAQGELDGPAVADLLAAQPALRAAGVDLSLADALFAAARVGARAAAIHQAIEATIAARPASPAGYFAAVVRRTEGEYVRWAEYQAAQQAERAAREAAWAEIV